jgi:hypothetical protein
LPGRAQHQGARRAADDGRAVHLLQPQVHCGARYLSADP